MAAAAPNGSLAGELSYDMGVALKKEDRQTDRQTDRKKERRKEEVMANINYL